MVTMACVRVPCIREPGLSRYGRRWHAHSFESRAEYEAWKVLDRLLPPDEQRCPPDESTALRAVAAW